MDDINSKDFSVPLDPEAPLFIISVVSNMVQIPIWTLRKLDELGIVQPLRHGKKIRCYSVKQIKTLNYIHYLMTERRVNISGIKFILEIKEE
jgi:MerR family transcriptional regulator, heat shock protein HspR